MSTLPAERVLAAITTIPSLPAVVTELMLRLDDDNVELSTVSRKIAVDPALTARVLGLANSSFYGLQRQVTTPDEAVAVLGLHNLRRVIATAAIMGKLPIDQASAIAFEPYWRHAIGAALCARGIAAKTGLNPESAYVAGLLHDIGRLVLATRFADSYKSALDHHHEAGIPLVQAEDAELGLNHAQVGAAIASHWNFPEPIRQAIAGHHETSQPALDTMAMVVHAADSLAHAMEFEGADKARITPIQPAAWQRLALNEDQMRAVAHDANAGFAMACSVMQ